MRVTSILALLASLALTTTVPAAAAVSETWNEMRARFLRGCDTDDVVCRHVRSAYLNQIRETWPEVTMRRWRAPIRVMTVGLNDEGRGIFLDLLEGLAKPAGLQVEILEDSDATRANFVFVVAPDMNELLKRPWLARLNTPSQTGTDQTMVYFETKRTAMLLHRPSNDWTRPRMEHCVGAATPERLQDKPGLLFARFIFRCLTGTIPSNELKPSLLNDDGAAAPLYAEPYARMASADRVMLAVMYESATPIESMFGVNAANLIVQKMHERGIGNDGAPAGK